VDASVLLSTSGVVRPISRWVAKVGLLLDLSAFGCWSRAFFAVPLCFSSLRVFQWLLASRLQIQLWELILKRRSLTKEFS
jgi:hypothetical protein